MNRFGCKLKQLRKSRNLTVSDLAKLAGIARSTLYRWENGEVIPQSLESVILLADALQVPFEALNYFDNSDFEEKLTKSPVIEHILQRLDKLENT